ncbi:MAG: synaptobrevin-B [bacterium]|nr:synaptobrevin-B [bacterium]
MMNFSNKKTKKIFAAVLVVLLVVSMVLPVLMSALA